MSTLILICGTARSGSTLLDVMLGHAQDAFSCGEIFAHFRPHRKHHFTLQCPCQQEPCPYWKQLLAVPASRFHAYACTQLHLQFIVDSSKELCWVFDSNYWARRAGMRVVNVVTWKDPIGLVYSSWKRGRSLDAWRGEFIGYYQSLFSLGLPLLTVSLDTLMQSPSKQLRLLCQEIGMPYFEEKELFWKKQQHQLFGSPSVLKAVIEKRGTLRSKECIPDQFWDETSTYLQDLEKDEEIQTLVKMLRSKTAELSIRDHSTRASWRRIPPRWYYRRRLITFFRRWFPQEFVPAQDAF